MSIHGEKDGFFMRVMNVGCATLVVITVIWLILIAVL